jgi:hypothetical protein
MMEDKNTNKEGMFSGSETKNPLAFEIENNKEKIINIIDNLKLQNPSKIVYSILELFTLPPFILYTPI